MSTIEQTVELCEPFTDACIRFKALFDSGSQETIIRESLLREHLPQAEIKETGKTVPLRMANGQVHKVPEKLVQLRLSVGRGCRTLVRTLRVVEDLDVQAIIGASEMEAIEMTLRFSDRYGSSAGCIQPIVLPSANLGGVPGGE